MKHMKQLPKYVMNSTSERNPELPPFPRSSFFYTLFLFVFLHIHPAKSQSTPQKICGKWQYVSIFNAAGQAARKISDNDTLVLGCNAENTFTYDLHMENIHAFGTWELVQNTLHLTYRTPGSHLDSKAVSIRSFRILHKDDQRLLIRELLANAEEGLYFLYTKED